MIYTIPWAPVVALLMAAVLLLVVPVVAVTMLVTALLVTAVLLAMTLVATAVAIPYLALRLAFRSWRAVRGARLRIPGRRRAAAADQRLARIR
jgi:membrane protein implicated in regulation of membrane protease activity